MKFSYEYVKEYIELKIGYKLLSEEYIDSRTKLKLKCEKDHIFKATFDNIKNNNTRCMKCVKYELGLKYKHDFNYIKSYFNKYNYKLTSEIYINSKIKLNLICPKGHKCQINYNNFKSGTRCKICKYEKHSEQFSGENNPAWKDDRESLKIIKRLRKSFSRSWIRNNMKHDNNYNKFLLNPNEYHLDHIIPISAFSELFKDKNFNETKLKKIVNHKRNLQLLTEKENLKKSIKFKQEDLDKYIKIHYYKGIILC